MMSKFRLPPHLVSDGRTKRCSDCGLGFVADSQPSLNKAFEEHVQAAHKAKPVPAEPGRGKQ
jgi:hypothetical protein